VAEERRGHRAQYARVHLRWPGAEEETRGRRELAGDRGHGRALYTSAGAPSRRKSVAPRLRGAFRLAGDPVQRLTHAGAVVVRRDGDEPRFLVVQPSRGRRGWVLPKGHIERGERPLATAKREVREEAGVAVKNGRSLGTVAFDQLGEPVRARFYLFDYAGPAPRDEPRRRAWCGYREALRRVVFPESKTVVERAWRALGARRGRRRARP